jgi:hypothetical protein
VHFLLFTCGSPLHLQDLLVRHLLDPMHIEVNVAKAVFRHIYGELDNKKVRKDCKIAKVHKSAWLKKRNGEVETPTAGWVLPERILKSMNQTFMNTRFPTYYGAKIKNSVKTVGSKRPTGLKSHDYHKMMQHMLPIALRSAGASAVKKDLCTAINEISAVFW